MNHHRVSLAGTLTSGQQYPVVLLLVLFDYFKIPLKLRTCVFDSCVFFLKHTIHEFYE